MSTLGPYAGVLSVLALIALSVAYVRLTREVRELRLASHGARPPARRSDPRRPAPSRRALPIAAAALAAAALVAGTATLLLRGGDEPAAAERGSPPADPRAEIRVMVLNATGTNGVARGVSRELRRKGFGRGRMGNASATLQETEVAYLPGRRREAGEVARALGVSRVDPAGLELQRTAGRATVVVLAGADREEL